jgi:hypothetical protein
MTTELQERQQAMAERARENEYDVVEHVAQTRIEALATQNNLAKKFFQVIDKNVSALNEQGELDLNGRRDLESYARTAKLVADIQVRAAGIDLISRPKPPEEASAGRVNFFVNCAPVGVAGRQTINVTAEGSSRPILD